MTEDAMPLPTAEQDYTMPADPIPAGAPLIAALCEAIGADRVLTDAASLELSGLDIRWQAEHRSIAVVRPRSVEELSRAVALATGAGHAVVPRGGALSYTRGYLPRTAGSVTIDLAGMNRILDLDLANMRVTVEAGATWQQLHAALAGTGVRTPMWGTLSGIRATIGGGMSQNSIFFGSGTGGITADSALSLKVVLADGRVLDTGTAAAEGCAPFFRWYGPDLTGLFLGDTGALGIKATVTLKLVPMAGATGFASYVFPTHAALFDAMRGVAREGLASECFAFDPGLNGQESGDADLVSDVKAVVAVARRGIGGLIGAARIALAGRRVFSRDGWGMHCAVEADDAASLRKRVRRVAAIAGKAGGRAIEGSIPRIMHAQPFTPPTSMVGVRGERWASVHGVVEPSAATAAMDAITALRAEMAPALAAHGIVTGTLAVTLSTHAFVIEPVCWWKAPNTRFHAEALGPDYMARFPVYPEAPEATALVDEVHARSVALLRTHGASFLQIGKYYPYHGVLSPVAREAIAGIKRVLDPYGLMNPGSLGLA
jgi:FAD/FMN-containing dehydrogenase